MTVGFFQGLGKIFHAFKFNFFLTKVRTYLTTNLTDNYYLKFVIWVAYIVVLISISFVVTRLLAPQAAGSGVAEMKVVLRGVILKEYLSLKTLAAKVVGLTFALSSGLPLGKEGPFVHIASITANQLMKLFAFVTGRDEYESKYFEIIAVACGVGVAVTFAAPGLCRFGLSENPNNL